MRIVAAAIKFHLVDSDSFIVLTGFRHSDIFEQAQRLKINYDRWMIAQGFLTDENTFVDRQEAREIAEKANQIVPKKDTYAQLYSEDLW